MMKGLDPKKQVLEELMGYLDDKDGEELGSVLKPKDASLEVTKVETSEEGAAPEVEVAAEAKPEMSDEELSELIEALSSKLGG